MADYEEKMQKALDNLESEYGTIRAGRANPHILDKIKVDYYGTPTPLRNIANISAPDPKSLQITPFDPSSLGDIERAINIANLGITPTNDGKNIRLVIPDLTEEIILKRKKLLLRIKYLILQLLKLICGISLCVRFGGTDRADLCRWVRPYRRINM